MAETQAKSTTMVLDANHHKPSTKQSSKLPDSFTRKKLKILADLSVPLSDYDDLSPKGSIDVSIRDLIDEINEIDGLVTTSSCGGRVSVFLEGVKKDDISHNPKEENGDADEPERDVNAQDRPATLAAVGGKGGGGRWLYVSHDPVELMDIRDQILARFLGIDETREQSAYEGALETERLIHFKFEPMILHILTASPAYAQTVLTAAFGAGFRESGALNLFHSSTEFNAAHTPIVAVRTMGLSLESILGYHDAAKDTTVCILSDPLLKGLISIANQRFTENTKRIQRFRDLLKKGIDVLSGESGVRKKANGEEWEDTEARKQRKRAEGLRRAQVLREAAQKQSEEEGVVLSTG